MSLRARLKVNTIAIGLATLCGLFALIFTGVALYNYFLFVFLPDIAALITAVVFLLLALLILLCAKLYSLQSRRATAAELYRTNNPVEEALQSVVNPEVSNWIRQHPGRSLAMTVVAGLIVGSNEEARNMLKKLYDQYFGDN